MIIQNSDVDYVVSFAYNRHTVANYRSALKPLIGTELNTGNIQRYVSGWRGLSRSTITVRRAALRKFAKVMYSNGKCERDILDGIMYPEGRPPTTRGKISNEDLKKMFDVTRTATERLLLTVLLDTGLRIGSLPELKFGDLLSDSFEVLVKRGRLLEVFPTDSCSSLARETMTETNTSDDDYVFQTISGKKSYTKLLSRMLKKITTAAGVRVTAHHFRHTFITAIADGYDIVVAQELAGHRSINTTRMYVHPQRSRLVDAAVKSGKASAFQGGHNG